MNLFKHKKDKSEGDTFVSVYDIQSQTVNLIPARELAPGMIQVEVEGIEGAVWMEAALLKQGEVKHPPFEEKVLVFLREIQDATAEFYPLSLEKWEDGFRRDANAEREIALWVHLARNYKQLLAARQWNYDERKEIFQVLIACMNSPEEHALKTCSLHALSTQDAAKVVRQFFTAGQ